MPELPEVETVKRSLEKLTLGRRIKNLKVLRKGYVHTGYALRSKVSGSTIQSVERKGKIMAIHLSSGIVMLHHLGMTGRLLLMPSKSELARHTHIRIFFDDGEYELRQWDPRRFGYFALLAKDDLPDFPSWKNLGIDPFDLRSAQFIEMLQNRKQAIKTFLLDQRRIAGIGNIYADESLFRTNIHPARKAEDIGHDEAKQLLRNIKQVLKESIAAGGSSTSDYQKLDGTFGQFQHKHRVYRLTGQPCKTCNAEIQRTVINGRSSHFCPQCQLESD